MRLVGLSIIAVAALANLAVPARGQQGPAPVPAESTADYYGRPSATPPGTVEGSWVSDEQPIADNPPEAPLPGPATTPAPTPDALNLQGAPAVQPQSEYNPQQYEGADSYGGGEQQGDGGGGPYMTDLWTEVHLHRRVYGKFEVLSLWGKGSHMPPLVTTSTDVNAPQATAGVLGQPTTRVLFGNERVDGGARAAGRLTIGAWLVDGEFLGVEGHYMGVGQGNTTFNAVSTFTDGTQPGDRVLVRPFTDFNPGRPGTPLPSNAILAIPAFNFFNNTVPLDGSVNIKTTVDTQSAGVLLRKLLWVDFTGKSRVDAVAGYRFFRLDDSVTINDSTFTPAVGFFAPTQFSSRDQFVAHNQFHGAEVGLIAQRYYGPWSLETTLKVAFGNVNQQVSVAGFNTITVAGVPVSSVGGLLAQPSNIGTYTRNRFAVLPELGMNLKYDLSCNWRALVGYNFTYLSQAVRSGNQLDLRLNPTQIPPGTLTGRALPAFTFKENNYFLQGINLGLEYRY